MANRLMASATSANARNVAMLLPHPDLVAWYGTGSPDIEWTEADRALFPDSIMVEIDQAFTGSPVPQATIRDVESGAWSVLDAINHNPWTAKRRTIYCSRNTIPELHLAGWTGDVWLADPEFTGDTPPDLGPMTCVAVQNVFTEEYQTSIVFDAHWPDNGDNVPPSELVSVTIGNRHANAAWARNPVAGHYVVNYVAPGTSTEVLVCRATQPQAGKVVHVTDMVIPGSHGGLLKVYSIVESTPIIVGTRVLP